LTNSLKNDSNVLILVVIIENRGTFS